MCDWMAVVSLHRYSELFKRYNINGVELENLEKERIHVMRIRDDFHIESILISIQALKQQQQQDAVAPTSIQESNHQLSIYSFTSLQECCVCGTYLLGIIQQGCQCRVCGMCCHRRCRVLQLPECGDGDVRKRDSFIQDCLFGQGLHEFTTSPPPIISLCTQELQKRALNNNVSLLQFYRQTPSTYNVLQLKQSIIHDSTPDLATTATILHDHTTETIGGIVKKFLRDLPDSVIPEALYRPFISIVAEDLSITETKTLLRQLPLCHYTSLEFLLNHLASDHMSDKQTHERLAHIFSNILLRPPWNQIMDIVHNSRLQSQTLHFLMSHKSVLFISEKLPGIPHSWYFRDISRDEVDELMMNCPDGSFLVRNAGIWDPSEPYTLTLRKNGTNKLIKIGRWGCLFGLSSKPPLFSSIEGLVAHYTQHSLASFHRSLDITLQHPLERERPAEADTQVDKNILRSDFMKVCDEISKLMLKMEALNCDHDAFSDLLRVYQNDMEAIKKVIVVYGQQMDTSRKFIKDRSCTRDMKRHGEEGVKKMERKKDVLEKNKKRIEVEIGETRRNIKVVAKSLEEEKENLKALDAKKEDKKKMLIDLDESQSNIELLQSGSDVQVEEEIAHAQEGTWFVEGERRRAIELLADKPSGTFLIRPRTSDNNHALSIVSQNKEVVHCVIERESTGYGFTDPYYIHPRLIDLVLHYKDVSLKEHNDTLDVTLKYPVFA